MEICLSIRDVARALHIQERTLQRFIRRGVVRVAGKAINTDGPLEFQLIDLLAVAVSCDLMRRGFSETQAARVCAFFRHFTLDDLRLQWASGRDLLLSVADAPAFPKLLTRAEVFENSHIDLEAALSIGVPVAVIDTHEAFRQIDVILGPHAEQLERGAEKCPA